MQIVLNYLLQTPITDTEQFLEISFFKLPLHRTCQLKRAEQR